MSVRLLPMRKSWNVKRTILALLLVAFLLLLPQISLAQADPGLNTGLTEAQGIGLGQTGLKTIITNTVRIILGFIGIILVILILYGGFTWMTAGGDASKIDRAKKILINAVIGLIIILAAYGIVSFVVNRFLGIGDGGNPAINTGRGGSGDYGRVGIGGGAIRSVYPNAGQRNVPINVDVAVTFKEAVDPETVCSDGSCDANDNISICQADQCETGATGDFTADKYYGVTVSTSDNKTFVFNVKAHKYLGENDGQEREFKVTLSSGIQSAQGGSVFSGRYSGGYTWSFFTNGRLDLNPPNVLDKVGVYPNPDDSADQFSVGSNPTPAKFAVTVSNVGSIQSASASTVSPRSPDDSVSGSGAVTATITGNYTGSYSGTVTVLANNSDPNAIKIETNWDGNDGPEITTDYSDGTVLDIGSYGLTFNIDGDISAGSSHRWTFDVQAAQLGDRIDVVTGTRSGGSYVFADGDPVVGYYMFGSDPYPGDDPHPYQYINIDGITDLNTVKNRIVSTLIGRGVFTSCRAGDGCDLKTSATGVSANRYGINFVKSNQDAPAGVLITNPQEAADTVTSRDIRGLFDPTKDSLFEINFSEAVNPKNIADHIEVKRNCVDGTSGCSGGFKNLIEGVDYIIETANEYKTVVLSRKVPGIEPCAINNCGKEKYCWPTLADDDPTNNGSTLYTVEIKAAKLGYDADVCGNWNGNPAADHDRCHKEINGKDVYYPSGVSDSGLVDMSGNSFNGSFNTYEFDGKILGISEGQSGINDGQSGSVTFDINSNIQTHNSHRGAIEVLTYGTSTPTYITADDWSADSNPNGTDKGGDNLKWSFYISDEIDTEAPIISSISPVSNQTIDAISDPVEVNFNKLMNASTLKSGWGYGDRNTAERTLRYMAVVTLTNTGNPVSYWITKENRDSDGDGWADYTRAYINHNEFDSAMRYAPLVGSGLESITQNCFLPSVGPADGGDGECSYNGTEFSNCTENTNTDTAVVSFATMSCNEIIGANVCVKNEVCKPLFTEIGKICEDPNNPNNTTNGLDCTNDATVCEGGNSACVDSVGGSWVITEDFNLSSYSTPNNGGCCLGRCE